MKTGAKGTVKSSEKAIKTAEKTSKAAIKTAEKTAKATQKAAQATAKAAQKAAEMARQAAIAAYKAAVAAAKAIAAAIKAIAAAIKELIAAIAAGGWVAVVVIIVICLIGLIVASCFGIFFSSEDTGSTQTMQQVVQEINMDYQNKLDDIKNSNTYDELETIDEALTKLQMSSFRAKFHLSERDRKYIEEKGIDKVREHAADFVSRRLAPAVIPNDGKQTPMRGHPVFVAQHACACCCRGCLNKWYKVPIGTELTKNQQERIVNLLMAWIEKQIDQGGI